MRNNENKLSLFDFTKARIVMRLATGKTFLQQLDEVNERRQAESQYSRPKVRTTEYDKALYNLEPGDRKGEIYQGDKNQTARMNLKKDSVNISVPLTESIDFSEAKNGAQANKLAKAAIDTTDKPYDIVSVSGWKKDPSKQKLTVATKASYDDLMKNQTPEAKQINAEFPDWKKQRTMDWSDAERMDTLYENQKLLNKPLELGHYESNDLTLDGLDNRKEL